MGSLYTTLRNRVPANALRFIDVCAQELPEYRALVATADGHAKVLEATMFAWRIPLDHAPHDQPFSGEDLSLIGAIGEDRGTKGIHVQAGRRTFALYTSAFLHQIHDAAGPSDLGAGLHLLAWLGQHVPVTHQVYTAGILRGLKRQLPVFGQVGQFAELALAGDPVAPMYAENLGIAPHGHFRVVVIRTSTHDEQTGKRSEGVLEMAWRRHHAPATWHRPDELVALLAVDKQTSALALVRDVAEIMGRPCGAGTDAGPLSTLAETFAMARRVSQVVPPQTRPDHLYTMADVFIEIGVAELPEIDRWLRGLARRLATGPDLRTTLDTYYRHDLDRSGTATALNVHLRTLDYRLRRAHELTGVDPRTVNGIRIFTTAITLGG
jgi:hypothetical protein